MRKDDRYCYNYEEFMEAINRDVPPDTILLPRSICPGHHKWRLETEGPEVFVAVCSRCGKRTMDPGVLLKLLDDFSPRRRRWMR